MRKWLIIFVAYFPVLLIAGQVAVNWLSFISPEWYASAGFYLNTFFGTNVFFAVMLVALTQILKFCEISRVAAWGQLLFAVNYMIVKVDGLYNIWFQIIVGTLALVATFMHYAKKYPLCRIGLVATFFSSIVAKKGNCKKGVEHWERNIKAIILKQHHANHSKNRL